MTKTELYLVEKVAKLETKISQLESRQRSLRADITRIAKALMGIRS